MIQISSALESAVKAKLNEQFPSGVAEGESRAGIGTYLAVRDPTEGEIQQIASSLVARAIADVTSSMTNKSIGGYSEVDLAASDQADCVAEGGDTVSAFISGQRCYRLVLTVRVS